MKKHPGLLWGLGFIALLALSAGEASAAPMSLTVFLNGTSVYSVTGTNQGVTADAAALTTALNSGSIHSGYSFSSLSGASDFPGATGPVGGYVSDAGNVTFTPGGTGGLLKIVVTENGFTAPVSGTGTTLTGTATAIYSGAATTSSQSFVGNFKDNSAVNVNTPTIVQLANGTSHDAHANTVTAGVPTYVIPYTLTNTTMIRLTSSGSSPSNDVFTGKTSIVTTAVPEPASLIMMVAGMPLPLVVMGLLRRRRAAA